MKKIFCIGFPKTGTTTLEHALNILGYNVCKGHYNNNHTNYLISLFYHKDYEEINKIIHYFDAFCDGPWGGTDFYIYLSKEYPDAKFIHTTREFNNWYESLEAMLTKFDDNLDTALDTFHQNTRYGAIYYLNNEFNIKKLSGSKETIIRHYNQRNEDIIEHFKSHPNRYLNIDLTTDDNPWGKLCVFLNKENPEVPFPHRNKRPVKKLNRHSF